jgi:hypothetical protein
MTKRKLTADEQWWINLANYELDQELKEAMEAYDQRPPKEDLEEWLGIGLA